MAGVEQIPAMMAELAALRAELNQTRGELAQTQAGAVAMMAALPQALAGSTKATQVLSDRSKPSMLDLRHWAAVDLRQQLG